jgi:Ca2+-binding RTX toxin-like protein
MLTVRGDQQDNTITVSRDAAGTLLVNGGAVQITDGPSTIANTSLIEISGLGGNDTLTLDQANGALPRADLFGGNGNDVLSGGAGNDTLKGQQGDDTLLGRGGTDMLFGGPDNDALAGDDVVEASALAASAIQLKADGGDGADVLIGGAGNDTLLGGEGDDVLLGGPGVDTLDGGPGDNIIIQD